MIGRTGWWKLLALSVFLLPSTASADPLIPWPWLESSRYSVWQRDRDQVRADWYARRALDPVGSRRRYVKGKFWPPFPRPEGVSQLPTHKYHSAHYWPYPYTCHDRQSVREFIAAQEEAGWTQATTVYAYHFDRDNHTLNRAGQLHVQWILRHTPISRRILYVQAGDTMASSQMRLASVQNSAFEMVGESNIPPVVLRVTSPIRRPAEEINSIHEADRKTILAPRISVPFGGGTSGGGSGGGSGGSGI